MGPTDGRKGYGKRELSTSKRAAQNRAAQVCDLLSPVLIDADYGTREHFDNGKRDISRNLRNKYETIKF